MFDIKKVADEADMIVNGYAFTRCDEGFKVLNLNRPDSVIVISQSGETLETSMDDIEVQIVKDYYRKNKKYIDDEYMGNFIALENKLGISNSVELAEMEEKISKKRAVELFESGKLMSLEAGRFKALAEIHRYLFEQIYDFAGQIRNVNIAKEDFRFVPVMYLQAAIESVEKMPQSNFDEIIEKYVEMNIVHPFREGNGRSTRIWLDLILKKELRLVIDWSLVDKYDYLLAMERSPVKDIEIKYILKQALTDKIEDMDIYMKGIDYSYYYEGYAVYKAEDL